MIDDHPIVHKSPILRGPDDPRALQPEVPVIPARHRSAEPQLTARLDRAVEFNLLPGRGDLPEETIILALVAVLSHGVTLRLELDLQDAVRGSIDSPGDGLEVERTWLRDRVARGAPTHVEIDGDGASLAPQGLLQSEGLVVSDSTGQLERHDGEGPAL